MLWKEELEKAIKDLESKSKSFSDCEKLSALYTVYDHHFAPKEQKESRAVYTETVIDDYGDSEFFETIRDREAESVWAVIDELMMTLQLLNPKLFTFLFSGFRFPYCTYIISYVRAYVKIF